MRVGIKEDESVTMERFMSGLSLEIRNRVELLPYRDFHYLVQIYVKVEQQILRKGPSRSSYSNSSQATSWKGGGVCKRKTKENSSKAIVQESFKKKGEHSTSNRISDIKCFKFLGWGHVKL